MKNTLEKLIFALKSEKKRLQFSFEIIEPHDLDNHSNINNIRHFRWVY